MNNPYFSIIIPAHNAEKRIYHGLSMIRRQTFKNYELIVVCDACDDNTKIVSQQYTNNVYSVDYHNDGLARSKGLDVAKGEWVMFMDDDDHWLHESVLEDIYNQIQLQPDAFDVLCMSAYWKGRGYIPVNGNNGHLFPNVWSKCWRRSVIGDTRFPNVYSVSDFEFCKLMDEKEPRFALWDYPFYYYQFMRPGSLTEINSREGKNE